MFKPIHVEHVDGVRDGADMGEMGGAGSSCSSPSALPWAFRTVTAAFLNIHSQAIPILVDTPGDCSLSLELSSLSGETTSQDLSSTLTTASTYIRWISN